MVTATADRAESRRSTAPIGTAELTVGYEGQILTRPVTVIQTVRQFSITLTIEQLDIGNF